MMTTSACGSLDLRFDWISGARIYQRDLDSPDLMIYRNIRSLVLVRRVGLVGTKLV
jgi:hypothetical protein